MPDVFCRPTGCLCSDKTCPRNICHAHNGYAVTVDDLSQNCNRFKPRYILTAETIIDAKNEITRLCSETGIDASKMLELVVAKNLSVADTSCLADYCAKITESTNA